MAQINKEIAESFKSLLRSFIRVDDDMDENDLILAYESLFNHQPIGSLIKNNRLSETVEYLREVMDSHQLSTLDAVGAHYVNKKRTIMESINEHIKQSENRDQLSVVEKTAVVKIKGASLYKNSFLKKQRSDVTKLLTIANRPFHHFINEVYRRMYVTEYYFRPKDEHMGISVHFFVPTPLQPSQLKNEISFVYLHQFCSYNNNRPINLINSGNRSSDCSHTEQLEKLQVTNFWIHFSRCVNAIFETDMEVSYQNHMKIIRSEQPVKDYILKKALFEWLLYFKLRKPDNCLSFFSHLKAYDKYNVDPSKEIDEDVTLSKVQSKLSDIVDDIYNNKLSLKKWTVLKSPPGLSWITSDNAGFIINLEDWCSQRHKPFVDTLLVRINPDSVIYFPLSKDYCLRIHPYELTEAYRPNAVHTPIEFEQSSEQELTIINRLTYCTQTSFIVAADIKSLALCNTKIRPYANLKS